MTEWDILEVRDILKEWNGKKKIIEQVKCESTSILAAKHFLFYRLATTGQTKLHSSFLTIRQKYKIVLSPDNTTGGHSRSGSDLIIVPGGRLAKRGYAGEKRLKFQQQFIANMFPHWVCLPNKGRDVTLHDLLKHQLSAPNFLSEHPSTDLTTRVPFQSLQTQNITARLSLQRLYINVLLLTWTTTIQICLFRLNTENVTTARPHSQPSERKRQSNNNNGIRGTAHAYT